MTIAFEGDVTLPTAIIITKVGIAARLIHDAGSTSLTKVGILTSIAAFAAVSTSIGVFEGITVAGILGVLCFANPITAGLASVISVGIVGAEDTSFNSQYNSEFIEHSSFESEDVTSEILADFEVI